MRHLVTFALALAALALPAAAGPTAEHYTFRIRTSAGAVPVGEVTRAADGSITAKGVAVPSIDKVTDQLVADWAAYKMPSSIEIVRYLPNGSYMANTTTKRTVAFTPKDALFKAAVLDRFLTAHKLDTVGMEQIEFIVHDTEGGQKGPEVVNDGGSSFTNFRKNTTLDFNNGHRAFYIYVPIHPPVPGNGPSDAKLALERSYDRGGIQIAWIDLAADGTVTIHAQHTAEKFEAELKSALAATSLTIGLYDNGEAKNVEIKQGDKRFFEAAIASVMNVNSYVVTPAPDPAVFR